MEKGKCILCENEAMVGGPFAINPKEIGLGRGKEYDCPNCGSYAIDDYAHSWIELFLKKKPEEKEKLSNYVKDHQGGDPPYCHLTRRKIEEILGYPIKLDIQ